MLAQVISLTKMSLIYLTMILAVRQNRVISNLNKLPFF